MLHTAFHTRPNDAGDAGATLSLPQDRMPYFPFARSYTTPVSPFLRWQLGYDLPTQGTPTAALFFPVNLGSLKRRKDGIDIDGLLPDWVLLRDREVMSFLQALVHSQQAKLNTDQRLTVASSSSSDTSRICGGGRGVRSLSSSASLSEVGLSCCCFFRGARFALLLPLPFFGLGEGKREGEGEREGERPRRPRGGSDSAAVSESWSTLEVDGCGRLFGFGGNEISSSLDGFLSSLPVCGGLGFRERVIAESLDVLVVG